MALILYRKYRPQTFKEVIGQNHIKVTLQNELEMGRIAHAYLFSGPRGLGKTTVARLLAKAVNCLNRQEGQNEPCNQCDSCLEVKGGKSLDVVEIDAASHTGVDNVRENIINSSRFTPTLRKYKVYIIDEVHMLSISAFNALLKTLEEPPAHAIFILATTEIHKVPQTIISRCQRFDFRKVSKKDLIQRLEYLVAQEEKKVDKVVLENIAQYAEGCVRDAETLLSQILSLDEKEITKEQAELVIPVSRLDLVMELINYLVKGNSAQAIALINRLVQEGIDLPRFSGDLIEVLRKMLLVKIGSQLEEFTTTLNQSLEQEISTINKDIRLEDLIKMIDVFIEAKRQLKSAEIVQLPLEMAVVEICHKTDQPKIDKENDDNKEKSGDSGVFGPTAEETGSGGNINDYPKILKSEKKATAVKAEEETPPKKELGKIKLTLEQVRDRWGEVLLCLKEFNQSLASTLRFHQPSSVKDDGTVEICFKYKFHQQRVNDLKNRQTLEKILEQIFKTPIRVKTIMVKELPEGKLEIQSLTEHSNQAVDNVLKNFGGQLIE